MATSGQNRINASGCDRPILRDLVNHVVPFASNQWYDLGLQLLDPKYAHELDTIEAADTKNDTKTCCRKMFSKWMKTDLLASWDKVIEALKLIGLNDVARSIKQLLQQANCSSSTVCSTDEPVATERRRKKAKSKKGGAERRKRSVSPISVENRSAVQQGRTLQSNTKPSFKPPEDYPDICSSSTDDSTGEPVAIQRGKKKTKSKKGGTDSRKSDSTESVETRSVDRARTTLQFNTKPSFQSLSDNYSPSTDHSTYEPVVTENTKGATERWKKPVSTQSVVDWMSEFMKGRYCSMQLSNLQEENDPWPPVKAKVYITLALMYQKAIQTRAETAKTIFLRTKGDISNVPEKLNSQKITEIAQIFSSQCGEIPRSVLIEGQPVIGKTTLVKKICVEWAESKLLTSDKLVLLLLLRDPNAQKITTVLDLLKHFIRSTRKVTQLNSYLEDNNGANFTLIIDGFDELDDKLRTKSFFYDMIEKKILPKARIVVTSRPTVSACLHHIVHRRIEILGFDQISRIEYAKEAFQDSPSKLEKLQKHFLHYPNIDAICYIPLIMCIIVFLCMCQPEDLPPTASKMYYSFVLHTICHYLKRTGKIGEDEHINKMEHLPLPVQQALLQLQEVAFDGLVEDKIVFTIDDLPKMCRDDPTCYGLLQSVECYSAEIGPPTKSFNFLHLGIQEYFAARYVATKTKDYVDTLLNKYFIPVTATEENQDIDFIDATDDTISEPDDDNLYSKNARFSNMWIMYFGITSGQCNSLRRYLFIPINPPCTCTPVSNYSYSPDFNQINKSASPTHWDMLYEQPTAIIHSQPVMSSKSLHFSSSSLTTPSSSVRYTPRSRAAHRVNLDRLSYQPCSLKHSASNQEIFNTMNISQHILKDPVKVLYLFQCFQEAQDDYLCNILSKSFDSGKIDISGHKRHLYQVASLGFFLSKSNRKWEELNLNDCHIGDNGINLLYHYLCGDATNKLQIAKIVLNYNDLTEASSFFISEIVAHLQVQVIPATSCSQLHISDNKLGDDGAVILSQRVIVSNILRVLYISRNEITTTGATAIANSLLQNSSLETLHMNYNAIGQDGAIGLAQVIAINNTLKELYLWGDDTIDEESAMIIIKSLHFSNSVTKLGLPWKLRHTDNLREEVKNINSTERKQCNKELIVDYS